ncbi:hypothetical protein CW304_21675 [Bacillus sp. UFRGS-B20]|nr:hypothetical protein CW304_21675 [Bacillus sp. UFRGS-B20]
MFCRFQENPSGIDKVLFFPSKTSQLTNYGLLVLCRRRVNEFVHAILIFKLIFDSLKLLHFFI